MECSILGVIDASDLAFSSCGFLDTMVAPLVAQSQTVPPESGGAFTSTLWSVIILSLLFRPEASIHRVPRARDHP